MIFFRSLAILALLCLALSGAGIPAASAQTPEVTPRGSGRAIVDKITFPFRWVHKKLQKKETEEKDAPVGEVVLPPPTEADSLVTTAEPPLPAEVPPGSEPQAPQPPLLPGEEPPPPPPPSSPLFPDPHWAFVPIQELRSSYDFIFAVSDIHGMLKSLTPLLKAAQLITPASTDEKYVWAGTKQVGRRFLLIVTGDMIDKGPDSVAVVQRLMELQTQAEAKGGRVIALLGNHEAEFLADRSNCDESLLKSAKGIPGIQQGNKLSCKDLHESFVGDWLRTLPVGAVVGTWLASHSGYLAEKDVRAARTAPQKQAALVRFIRETSQAHATKDYKALVDEERSILKTHDWWKEFYTESGQILPSLGLTGQLVGHEPGFMDARNTMAVNKSGWLIKLDSGMNPDQKEGKDRILLCKVSDILAANRNVIFMRMVDPARGPLCGQVGPKGMHPLTMVNM